MTTNSMAAWNALLIISMLALAGAVVYDQLVPAPKLDVSPRARKLRQDKVISEVTLLDKQAREAKAQLLARIWEEEPEAIGPAAMDVITRSAKKHGLVVGSFRPQKPVEEPPLTRFPYIVSIDGTYLGVLSFVRDLERPENKIVVNSIQIASADGASSAVTATVAIWAFKETTTQTKPKATAKRNV